MQSKKIKELLSGKDPLVVAKKIRASTHADPFFVFWIGPDGAIYNALDSHHLNPPQGSKDILHDRNHCGYLRGRAVLIEKEMLVVTYGYRGFDLAPWQIVLLKKTKLKDYLYEKANVENKEVLNIFFITEIGVVLDLS